MLEGDLFGLGLALEAAAGDEALAEDRAAGAMEHARLAGLAARYGVPEKGSSVLHVEASEAGWVTHSLKVDSTGRLTIRTMVDNFMRSIMLYLYDRMEHPTFTKKY